MLVTVVQAAVALALLVAVAVARRAIRERRRRLERATWPVGVTAADVAELYRAHHG